MIRRGEADGLIVTRLDRMSRSVRDAAEIFQTFKDKGWTLVMLDPAVDTSTPYGMAFASVAAVFAQLESDLISARTRETMRAMQARGVVFGRPPEISPAIEARIIQDFKAGVSMRGIADALTLDRVPTARGGNWTLATIQRVLARHNLSPDKLRSSSPNNLKETST